MNDIDLYIHCSDTQAQGHLQIVHGMDGKSGSEIYMYYMFNNIIL